MRQLRFKRVELFLTEDRLRIPTKLIAFGDALLRNNLVRLEVLHGLTNLEHILVVMQVEMDCPILYGGLRLHGQ